MVKNHFSSVAIQKKLMLLSKDSEHEPGHYIVQCMLAAIDELDKQICERHLNSASEVDKFSKRTGFMVGFAEIADSTGLDVIVEASHRWTSTDGNCQFCLSFVQKASFFTSLLQSIATKHSMRSFC